MQGILTADSVDTNVQNLCLQLYQNKDKQKEYIGTVALNTTMGTMRANIAACDNGATAFDATSQQECFEKKIKSIKAIYEGADKTKMQPGQIQTLVDYNAYATIYTDIEKVLANSNLSLNDWRAANAKLPSLDSAIIAYAASPNVDQQTLSDMKSQQQKIIDLVKKTCPTCK